jgi:AraC-like DNA-binding protein
LLKITLAGEGCFRDASGEHRIPPGYAFVCAVDDPKTSYYFPPDASMPWDMMWLQFSGEVASILIQALVARHGPVFKLGRDHPLVHRLLRYGSLRSSVSLQTPTEALLLIASAIDALAASAREGDSSKSDVVERAVSMIQQGLSSGLTVAGLAEAIGVTREHLSRQFALRLGSPVQTYLRRERVRQACVLLRSSKLPLKAISRLCGWSSSEVLIRSFAAELGMTPGHYKRSLRG